VLMSDMMTNTTGVRDLDASNSLDLVKQAAMLGSQLLRVGGTLLVKVFSGAHWPSYWRELQQQYNECALIRPPATRKDSAEIYALCKRLKKGAAIAAPTTANATQQPLSRTNTHSNDSSSEASTAKPRLTRTNSTKPRPP